MEILWDYYFSKKISEEDYGLHTLNKPIPIIVTLDEILEFLRLHYCPKSNTNVVKKDWVEKQ